MAPWAVDDKLRVEQTSTFCCTILLVNVLYFLSIPLNQRHWCQTQTVCCILEGLEDLEGLEGLGRHDCSPS